MGYFTLFKSDKNDDYYFNLKAANHEIILASQGYTTKAAAENGIESVKINVSEDRHFEHNIANNYQYYFNLKASNGQVIGTSQMYTTKASRDNGIESVKKNAPNAEVRN